MSEDVFSSLSPPLFPLTQLTMFTSDSAEPASFCVCETVRQSSPPTCNRGAAVTISGACLLFIVLFSLQFVYLTFNESPVFLDQQLSFKRGRGEGASLDLREQHEK